MLSVDHLLLLLGSVCGGIGLRETLLRHLFLPIKIALELCVLEGLAWVLSLH